MHLHVPSNCRCLLRGCTAVLPDLSLSLPPSLLPSVRLPSCISNGIRPAQQRRRPKNGAPLMRHKGFWMRASFCEYIRLVKQPLWRSFVPLPEPASAASLGCPFCHLPCSKAARSAICWLVRGSTFLLAREKKSTGTSRMWLTLTQSVIDSRFRMGTNFFVELGAKAASPDVFFFFL